MARGRWHWGQCWYRGQCWDDQCSTGGRYWGPVLVQGSGCRYRGQSRDGSAGTESPVLGLGVVLGVGPEVGAGTGVSAGVPVPVPSPSPEAQGGTGGGSRGAVLVSGSVPVCRWQYRGFGASTGVSAGMPVWYQGQWRYWGQGRMPVPVQSPWSRGSGWYWEWVWRSVPVPGSVLGCRCQYPVPMWGLGQYWGWLQGVDSDVGVSPGMLVPI